MILLNKRWTLALIGNNSNKSIIDTYNLAGNNCTTFTCDALRSGGVRIHDITTPSGFNLFMKGFGNWYYNRNK
ncbi:hypothetical protein HNP25_002055 [Arcicella rosea]|uniref:Uncharacterized protein n=1 Tax=Arcicella rosea TaxID=502909 RepID=A0A841EPU7_9BACT|nr:hypothetical protein [Arcicella rosea]